jgi:hypothetical protein
MKNVVYMKFLMQVNTEYSIRTKCQNQRPVRTVTRQALTVSIEECHGLYGIRGNNNKEKSKTALPALYVIT